MFGDIELASEVARYLMESNPGDIYIYVLFSDIEEYAEQVLPR